MKPDGRSPKWEADQGVGFFGYTPSQTKSGEKAAAQPLHFERVDIKRAIAEMGHVYLMHARARMQPHVPAFSGGLLDAWPAWAVEAFEIAQQEEASVKLFLESEARNG